MSSKRIETLIEDVNHVIQTGEGWTNEVAEWYAEDVKKKSIENAQKKSEERDFYLRMSNIGRPDCILWYEANTPKEEIRKKGTKTLNIFSFGDIIESYLLALVMASGHDVKSSQAQCELNGIKGSIDAIIDGMLVDVKSASDYGFQKFNRNNMAVFPPDSTFENGSTNDPFGYLAQITGYLKANQNNPDIKYKNMACFLVMNKKTGEIVLDAYKLDKYLDKIEKLIEHKKEVVSGDFPGRVFGPELDKSNKMGNYKLKNICSFCDFQRDCWRGEVRIFKYATGVKKLVNPLTVVPKKPELIGGQWVEWFDKEDEEDGEPSIG